MRVRQPLTDQQDEVGGEPQEELLGLKAHAITQGSYSSDRGQQQGEEDEGAKLNIPHLCPA